jgi:hypothetical protein
MEECAALDQMRRHNEKLYQRVRGLFFLYALHRFHLPQKDDFTTQGTIPFDGYEHLLKRRFEEAIDVFLARQAADGPNAAISSALAAAYHGLGFQTLADQVRRSVRSVRGNQWMFRTGHPADQPLRVRPELTQPGDNGLFPILRETTPVRMDLTHSGWSDIFFLGMDFPEGARVLNVSIDLRIYKVSHVAVNSLRPAFTATCIFQPTSIAAGVDEGLIVSGQVVVHHFLLFLLDQIGQVNLWVVFILENLSISTSLDRAIRLDAPT